MPELRRIDRAVLLGSLLLFALAAFPWITLPGPQQDELLFVQVVEPYAYGQTLYSCRWGDTEIPLMIMPYVGALKALLLQMVFAIFPPGLATVRAFGLVLGMVAIVLTQLFLRRHYSAAIAWLSTLLLATDPSYIHTLRMDFGPVAIMQVLKMAGLLLVSVWWSTGRRRYAAGAMFLFGAGLWDKANFIWFLTATGISAFLLFWPEIKQRLRPWTALVGLAALLAGALPLLAYNFTRLGSTVTERGQFEFRPVKLHAALGTLKGDALFVLTGEELLDASPEPKALAGASAAKVVRALGLAHSNITWHLLVVGLLLLPFTLRTPHRRGILFALLASVLMYLQMFFLRGGGGSAHHVVMLYPFPLVFLAASWQALGEQAQSRVLAPFVVAVAILFNLSVNARYLAVYAHTGGTQNFTDATYRLVSYMGEHRDSRFYLLDWGMSNPVAFLGHGYRLDWQELSELYLPTEDLGRRVDMLGELAASPRHRFVVRGGERTVFPGGRQALERLVSRSKLVKAAAFREKTGGVAFEVYRPPTGEARQEFPEK